MNAQEKLANEGRATWNMLSLAHFAIGACLVVEELVRAQSFWVLGIQFVLFLGQILMNRMVIKSKMSIWLYFGLLMFSGLWAFVIAGSQLGDFAKQGGGLWSYLLAFAGLAIMGMAVYLVYQPSVEAFLKQVQGQQD
jgi:hypothetical protein